MKRKEGKIVIRAEDGEEHTDKGKGTKSLSTHTHTCSLNTAFKYEIREISFIQRETKSYRAPTESRYFESSDLKIATLGASVQEAGSAFQVGTTREEKKYLRASKREYVVAILNLGPMPSRTRIGTQNEKGARINIDNTMNNFINRC